MAVIIVNVSESEGLTYGSGKQKYQLRINNHHKCFFYHTFEDGLATCLRKAADAFDEMESTKPGTWDRNTYLYNEYGKMEL